MSSNELMYMNWQEMIKPNKVQVNSTPTYGKFVCEPLERGFGITIGNSLRRIILSSLYGAAVVSVKFESVMHEFSAIPGVLEDVSEIILNLKGVRFRVSDDEPREVRIEAGKEGEVTAADIVSPDGQCEVLNPDHHIASLAADAELKMSMTVKVGKGYSLSESNKDEDVPVGTIPIDAVFSPIKRVNYVVGNARVGQRTDYDKLTLEVWTDGSLLPEEAVAYAKERVQFGKPIAAFQHNAFKLAEMATDIDGARLLVYRSAWMLDNNIKASKESAMAKVVATDVAMRVSVDAVQMLGGYGYMKEYPVEKMMRDAKLLQIYEGTNEIQKHVISLELLGSMKV